MQRLINGVHNSFVYLFLWFIGLVLIWWGYITTVLRLLFVCYLQTGLQFILHIVLMLFRVRWLCLLTVVWPYITLFHCNLLGTSVVICRGGSSSSNGVSSASRGKRSSSTSSRGVSISSRVPSIVAVETAYAKLLQQVTYIEKQLFLLRETYSIKEQKMVEQLVTKALSTKRRKDLFLKQQSRWDSLISSLGLTSSSAGLTSSRPSVTATKASVGVTSTKASVGVTSGKTSVGLASTKASVGLASTVIASKQISWDGFKVGRVVRKVNGTKATIVYNGVSKTGSFWTLEAISKQTVDGIIGATFGGVIEGKLVFTLLTPEHNCLIYSSDDTYIGDYGSTRVTVTTTGNMCTLVTRIAYSGEGHT